MKGVQAVRGGVYPLEIRASERIESNRSSSSPRSLHTRKLNLWSARVTTNTYANTACECAAHPRKNAPPTPPRHHKDLVTTHRSQAHTPLCIHRSNRRIIILGSFIFRGSQEHTAYDVCPLRLPKEGLKAGGGFQ